MSGEYDSVIDSNDIGQIILINEKEEVLLLRRSPEMDWAGDRWALPGGHIHYGENKKLGSKRETFEETELTTYNLELFAKQIINDGKEKTLFFYYTREYSGDIKLNFEHTDYKWLCIDDLNSLDIVENVKSKLLDLFTVLRFNKRESDS